MLLTFSERCNGSEYIRREVTVAGEANKVVIPFRIEDVQPKRGLRVRLADLHWIDAFVAREQAIKMRGVLERIERNGRHLPGLINDVLDLSKIEAGQLVLALSDYSLKTVVETVYTAVEPLAQEKKLAFKVEVATDLPSGHGDERRAHPSTPQSREQRHQVHRYGRGRDRGHASERIIRGYGARYGTGHFRS
jgi:signal transduction histidine kinase